MGYSSEKVSSLLGHTEVRYKKGEDVVITATPFNVFIAKIEITNQEELQQFAKDLSIAWKQHMKLRPDLSLVRNKI